MDLQEEERLILERRKALYELAKQELQKAADKLERDFNKRVDIFIYDKY